MVFFSYTQRECPLYIVQPYIPTRKAQTVFPNTNRSSEHSIRYYIRVACLACMSLFYLFFRRSRFAQLKPLGIANNRCRQSFHVYRPWEINFGSYVYSSKVAMAPVFASEGEGGGHSDYVMLSNASLCNDNQSGW